MKSVESSFEFANLTNELNNFSINSILCSAEVIRATHKATNKIISRESEKEIQKNLQLCERDVQKKKKKMEKVIFMT